MSESFGCPRCVPAEPVKIGRLGLVDVDRLVDESHFSLTIKRCEACGQRFAGIFTERIDWHGGEDSMTSNLLPLTDDEADRMLAAGADPDIAEVVAIGKTRQYLCDEHLTGRAATVGYEIGWSVPPHD